MFSERTIIARVVCLRRCGLGYRQHCSLNQRLTKQLIEHGNPTSNLSQSVKPGAVF